jgi:uncharacterized membrane protein YGL010W
MIGPEPAPADCSCHLPPSLKGVFLMSESFIENYKAKHQHPVNKLTHTIGIPMIVLSLPLFLFNWRWALGLFVVGWILQFVGHAVEGNQPAFFKNPMYLLVGPWWLLRRAAAAVGLARPSPSKSPRSPV